MRWAKPVLCCLVAPHFNRRARGTRREHIITALSAISAVIVLATSAGAAFAADDALAAARDLYASAAYEEALTALNRLRASGVAPPEALTVEQYRAFCLLALGRSADAQAAIEAVIVGDPLYHPSETEVSPRVRTAFSEVRRRLLPSLIPQQYAHAKAAFDRKEYAAAAAGFTRVLNTLADPDVVQAAGQSPLADVRTLATGFQELSAKAAEPPPPPLAPPPPPAPAPARPVPPRVFTPTDPDVVPPVTVRQNLPSFVGRLVAANPGELEVVIDERGLVESATMRVSVSPSYDKLALDAVRAWRYKPATLDGAAVKFRKIIQITIQPAP